MAAPADCTAPARPRPPPYSGEHAGAAAQSRLACAEAPGWRPAWSSLAEAAPRLRDWAGVEEAAAGLGRLPGAGGEAAWWRGKALLERGDAPGALGALGPAIAEAPGDVALRLLRASALEQSGDAAGAERQLEQARALAPGDARLRAELARLVALREARDRAFMGPDGGAEGGSG